MLHDGRVDFDGDYYSAHTDCSPRPREKVHVVIGGRPRRVVRMAGLHADEWNFFTERRDNFTRGKAILDEIQRGNSLFISESGPFLLGRTESELENNAEKLIQSQGKSTSPRDIIKQLRVDGSPCGTVEEFIKQIQGRIESGLRKFYFQTLVPGDVPMLELLADTLKRV